MINSLSELEILTLTIYGESRGEPIEGQIAVACVIRNRINNSKTYNDICLAPKQFSCWNEHDPNRIILEEIAQKLIAGQVIEDNMFEQCRWIANGIIKDIIIDNTNGAHNYLTSRLFDQASVSWAKNPEHPIKIGHQIFFNS